MRHSRKRVPHWSRGEKRPFNPLPSVVTQHALVMPSDNRYSLTVPQKTPKKNKIENNKEKITTFSIQCYGAKGAIIGAKRCHRQHFTCVLDKSKKNSK